MQMYLIMSTRQAQKLKKLEILTSGAPDWRATLLAMEARATRAVSLDDVTSESSLRRAVAKMNATGLGKWSANSVRDTPGLFTVTRKE